MRELELPAVPVPVDQPSRYRERLLRVTAEFEHVLWTLVSVTLVLDVSLTYYGLTLGLTEANPFMRFLFEQVGVVSLLVTKLLLLGVVGLVRRRIRAYGSIIPLALLLPWGTAGAVNLVLVVQAL